MQIDFVISEPCDYDCDYCKVKNYSNIITKDIIDKHKWLFDFIRKIKANVVIQGGDIGYVPEDTLQYLFDALKPLKPTLSVEQKFYEMNYHNIFKGQYTELFYHISDLKSIKPKAYPGKIGIVDKDINKITEFLDNNPNIPIDYIAFENDFTNISIEQINETNKIFQEALKKYNLDLYFPKDASEELRKKCTDASYITISLAKEKIVQCIRAYNIDMNLTKENLQKYILNPLTSDICNSCSRTFIDKPQWKSGEKVMSILKLKEK